MPDMKLISKHYIKISRFYDKNLKKSKNSRIVYFCNKLLYRRKGSNGGTFLPTNTVELHLSAHSH